VSKRVAPVATAVAAALMTSTAWSAASWQFDPAVEVGVLASDNYTLARGAVPESDVFGPYADVALTWLGRTPQTQMEFKPRVRAANFPGDSEQNSTSGYLDFRLDHDGEKSRSGFLARYTDEYIVDSELRGAAPGGGDLGQGGGPDAGRVTVDNRRQLLEADPYARFALSERTWIRGDLSYIDVSFDNEVIGSQQSYSTWTAGLGLGRDLTPNSALSLTARHSRYQPDAIGADIDTNGLRAQWDYRVAERMTAYVRGGVDRTDAPPGSTSSSTTTPLFGVGAQWQFQRSALFLDVLREVDANASGFVVKRNEIRVWGTHNFTQRLQGFAALYGVRDSAVQDTAAYAPRRYLNASAGMDWRFTRTFALAGQVSHSYQKFRGEADSADGTNVEVSIIWRPNRLDPR